MNMTFPLTPDIIDCVLTLLPDFATLLSTILASKSFYEVFQAHPGSTLISVATTQIGPEVLPCAIRLAHFNRGDYLASRVTYVQDFPSNRKFSHFEAPAVPSYAGALAKNDCVVRELEIFFSTTCKDRASGSRSLLNPHESLKFRRAFYRWWLFTDLFPPCSLRSTPPDPRTDEDDDGSAPDVYLAESHDLRKKFLSEFSDDEVVEMWQIHSLMGFVSFCVRNVASEPTMHEYLLLWNGPPTAADALRSLRSFENPEVRFKEQLNWDYNRPTEIWPGFDEYLQEKNYDTSKVQTSTWDPIPGSNVVLDSEVKSDEKCEECHAHHPGPKLWSSSNWHLLPCIILPEQVLDNLPGHLGWNRYETEPLSIIPWTFARFVDRHVSPGTKDWSEGKVLCTGCVLKLMGRRALDSLRELKAQHGPQLEDCWYGYKCRTQRRETHAIRLNHLCEPIRGD